MRAAFTGSWLLSGAVFLGIVGLAGCKAEAQKPTTSDANIAPQASSSTGGRSMKIELLSTAFKDGQRIPAKYTGEGEDVSPPLEWRGLPEATKQLALICDDPDAPRRSPGYTG